MRPPCRPSSDCRFAGIALAARERIRRVTRRLLYHCFWNFYDYLGTYLLLGLGSAAAVVGLLFVGGGLATVIPAAGAGIALLTLAAAIALKAWLSAGFFAFATRAAKDEPARLPHFREGARRLFPAYLKLGLLWVAVVAVIVSNIWFYSRMAGTLESSGLRLALAGASMLFLWVGVGLTLCMFCTAGVPARFPEERRLASVLRRGMMLFALAPGLWVGVGLLYTVVLILCVLSVVGLIFALPLLAVLVTTALEIVLRFVDDLSAARTQLGDGQSVRAYKRRALELGWEWEYRQPRRTLRELIKPWES